MNELKLFNFEEKEVRTLLINDEPWFVGKDIADNLGYRNGSRDINRHVDEDDRIKTMVFDGNQNKETIVINESGVYALVFGSKQPNAKKFKHWVTSEVLPQLRKTGKYAVRPANYKEALLELVAQIEENEKLEQQVAVQNQQLLEMTPKANYYDVILNCKDLMPITAIAKDYGKSAQWFNEYLHKLGVQFKRGGLWILYQQYAEQGYTSTKTHTYSKEDGFAHSKVHTYWTQKGRLFLYDLLKNHNVLPLIEGGACCELCS